MIKSRRVRLYTILAAAFLLPFAAIAEQIRFSNIRFETGSGWTVAFAATEMSLRSTDPAIADKVSVIINHATPYPDALRQALEETWIAAAANSTPRQEPGVTDERAIPGDGIEQEMGAKLEPEGGVYVAAVKSGDFLTTLVFKASTDAAYARGVALLLPLLASLEVVHDENLQVSGAGTGGASSPTVTFDWNGPGRLDYGVYDHGCMNYADEFMRLVNGNKLLIGSVRAQSMTWQQAFAAVRARLDEPAMKAGYAAGKASQDPKSDVSNALSLGEPEAALAQLFAAAEKSPEDPLRLFNFAAALSQNGMGNEAHAVIARIRELGKLPKLPLAVDAAAALDYQAGYAEMLRGNLGAAKTAFQGTMAREPFINEAAQALALIQAHEGNAAQAKKTYLAGMWRFKPKYLVFCGDPGSDDVRPPVDDMYDTSMGAEGKLVEFWHPDKAGDLEKFFPMAADLATQRLAIAEPLKQRMIAVSNNPRFANSTDDPYDAWADKMSQLIEGLDEFEPYLLKAQEALERERQSAESIAGQNQSFVLQRIMALSMRPGDHCHEFRSLITQGIQGVLPHAERVEAEFRNVARIWYKMATGLNSNIGDPEWFEYNDISLRAVLESMNAGMLATISTYYGFPADVVKECPEVFVPYGEPTQEETPDGDKCKEIFGNLKFNHTIELPKGMPGPKFDVEVGCDKIKVDGKWNTVDVSKGGAGLALGGRASGEFVRGKGFTLFAGVGSDVKALGQSGSAQAGAFISGDANGLTDLGGRVKLNRVDGTRETMDFGLMPKAQTAPRGPQLRNFRAAP